MACKSKTKCAERSCRTAVGYYSSIKFVVCRLHCVCEERKRFVSPPGRSSLDAELSVQLLHTALCVDVQEAASSPHWVLDCSPFPLLYILAQLHDQALRSVLIQILTFILYRFIPLNPFYESPLG